MQIFTTNLKSEDQECEMTPPFETSTEALFRKVIRNFYIVVGLLILLLVLESLALRA